MRKILILIVTFALTLPAAAKLPKLQRTIDTKEVLDTIAVAANQLILSGYDKPNGANKETFLVTNQMDSTITMLEVELTYEDMTGRMLHRRTEQVRCLIPSGETRSLKIATWDPNHSYHYFRSAAPSRKASVPYRVSSKPLRVVLGK